MVSPSTATLSLSDVRAQAALARVHDMLECMRDAWPLEHYPVSLVVVRPPQGSPVLPYLQAVPPVDGAHPHGVAQLNTWLEERMDAVCADIADAQVVSHLEALFAGRVLQGPATLPRVDVPLDARRPHAPRA